MNQRSSSHWTTSSPNKGIAMLEAIAMIALMSVLFMMVAQVIRLSHDIRHTSGMRDQALMHASNTLESWVYADADLLIADFPQVAQVDGVTTVLIPPPTPEPFLKRANTEVILQPRELQGTKVLEVAVKVQWNEQNQAHSIRLVGWRKPLEFEATADATASDKGLEQ